MKQIQLAIFYVGEPSREEAELLGPLLELEYNIRPVRSLVDLEDTVYSQGLRPDIVLVNRTSNLEPLEAAYFLLRNEVSPLYILVAEDIRINIRGQSELFNGGFNVSSYQGKVALGVLQLSNAAEFLKESILQNSPLRREGIFADFWQRRK